MGSAVKEKKGAFYVESITQVYVLFLFKFFDALVLCFFPLMTILQTRQLFLL